MSIIFIFVNFEIKGYYCDHYCAVLVGQLSFDYRLYCSCSCHVQGVGKGGEGGQDELGGEGGKSSVSDKGVKAGEGDHSG